MPMKPKARLRFVRGHLVVAVCAYELVALATGRIPTITKVSHTVRRHPLGAVSVAAGLGWLAHHLLIEEART